MIIESLLSITLQYGLIGLFLCSFLSALIFFPGIADYTLPFFVAMNFNPVLTFVSITSGSIMGASINYYLGFANSGLVAKNKVKKASVKKWINRWGEKSMFMLSLLPLPIPFDVFTVAAGYLKMNFKKFFMSMFAGRVIKYACLIVILILGINILVSAWNFITLSWLTHII